MMNRSDHQDDVNQECRNRRIVETNEEVEEVNKTNTRVLDGECSESTDENNLACESKGESLPEEEKAEHNGSCKLLDKGKGKEIAICDGNIDGNDDDEVSLRSVESCNSTGLISRGKKRQGFDYEHEPVLGSKRLKTLSQERLGSSSKLNQESSFVNWISNMTKGIWKGNQEEDSSVLALTSTTPVNTITGFQSFFRSIHCPTRKGSEDVVEIDPSNDAKQCLITNGDDHLSPFDNEIGLVAERDVTSGDNQTDKIISSEKKDAEKEVKVAYSEEGDEKVTIKRNSVLENLWISRFSSSSLPRKNDLLESMPNDAAIDKPKTMPRIVSSMRVESSEAMASMFSRRLESLKHFMSLGSLSENSCFYCGKKGHRLQDCVEVTDNELRDLVQNISVRTEREEEEEASSLCIRCFQLSHWAATCPNAPRKSSGGEDREAKHALASKEVPKAVFDAVQLLRLTRSDVLKWVNTKKSTSGLEGFFLRLRLGKWQEDIGGTGYYVARIDEAKEGQSSRTDIEKNSVSVKVGGMTYSVESRFISNHNFLEEELKAWWRSGGKFAGKSGGDGIPSEEELSRKIQQIKMLGF